MEEMQSLKFTLYRIQVFLPSQLPLYVEQKDPKDILRLAFSEKPTKHGNSISWHVGNIFEIGNEALYFAIGKKLSKRDGNLDESGDFHSEVRDVAPYTHAVLDLKYQVVAIAHSPELAQSSNSVAAKLSSLLQGTESVSEQSGEVSIKVINDPTEFLSAINDAYAVIRFQVSYGYPNVWDVEKDFQKPFQLTARELGSDESSAVFSSKSDLERKPLEKLVRAAAAIGKKVKASIKKHMGQRAVSMSLNNNPAKISTEVPASSQDMRWALHTINLVRTTYEEIRDRE